MDIEQTARETDAEIRREAAETADAVDAVSRDVRRGAAKVLNAAGDGAKKLGKRVKPGVTAKVSASIDETKRAARRAVAKIEPAAEDARGATLQFVRDHPWGTVALAAVSGAIITAILRARR